jgi:hypothetical protein
VLLAVLVALPLPSAGLPPARPAAPLKVGAINPPAIPSSSSAAGVAAGAPASASAQAIAAAQASLTAAWGTPAMLAGGACPLGTSGCRVDVSARVPHPTSPIPASKKANYPPPVTGAAIAYDPGVDTGDSYVAIFGGISQGGIPSAQTWIYESGYWENITPNASLHKVQPSARWDAMMAFDGNPSDQFIVLFGGCTGKDVEGLCLQSIGDTWKLYNGVWAQITVSSAPTARWDGAVTYDPQLQAVVVFGGATGLDDSLPPPGACTQPTPSFDSDTWKFSAATGRGAWTQLSSSSGPPASYGGRLAYDSADEVAVLFGGSTYYRTDQTCSQPNELALNTTGNMTVATWLLTAAGSWTSYSNGQSPPDRSDANMASAGGGAIILQGGTNDTGTVFTDVWQFRDESVGWTMLVGDASGAGPLNVTPVARYDAGFAWDGYGPDSYFLMVGGTSASGAVVGDVWSFAAPSRWTIQTPALAAPTMPSSRYQESMVFDDTLREVVLFGGESCGASSCTFLGDTWVFSSGLWHQLSTSVAPSSRFGAAMDYNPFTGVVLLYGGCGAVCPLGDTWQFARPPNGASPVWRELFPSVSPPARYYASMAFDPYDKITVLFGGCEGARGPCPVGDTWVYNTSLSNWKFLASASEANAPPARFGASMVALNRTASDVPGSFNGTLLFGGEGGFGMLSDTWNFSYWGSVPNKQGRWTEIETEVSPTPRVFGTLVFDPVDHSLLLFGGCENALCPALDPWVFSLQSPPTTNSSGGGGPPPGPGPPPPPPPPTTPPLWPWNTTNLTTDSQPGLPTQAPTTPRYGMVAVWDPIDGAVGYVLLVGGRTFSGATIPESDFIAGYLWTNLADYG